MRTALLFICIGLSTHGIMLAQSSDAIRIKGGVGGEKALPFSSRYRYDQFLDGKIIYQNGTVAGARLNYNVLLGEMQFIDPRGDTLALANEPVVRIVGIGQYTFWYDHSQGYLEIVEDYKSVKLAIKQTLKVAKSEKLAAYGQSSGTAAIVNYQFYSSENASVHKMDEKGDLVVIKSRIYILIDHNGRSYSFNRSNLLKVFSKHRDEVATYLTANPVDFSREDDLKKLLKYCSELV